MKTPATGGCRCGGLRFEITAAPILTSACHCRGCQRMTGGPYSLSVAIPAEGFQVTQGDEVAGGRDHGFGHRFCGHCLSWVFTRPPGMDAFVNVRSPMLDEPLKAAPFVEVCTSEALAWVSVGARHSFAEIPEMSEWPALVEAFVAADPAYRE